MSATTPLFGAEQTALTSDDYYTPAWVFERMGLQFDIDVAAPPGGVPWIPAARYFTKADDGLTAPWEGRVWMNPPFTKPGPWVDKFRSHRHGVCLIPCGKAAWFRRLWRDADGLAFGDEFDRWVFANGLSVSYTIMLAAFGPECVDAISRIGRVR